jgi:hypothetical protein
MQARELGSPGRRGSLSTFNRQPVGNADVPAMVAPSASTFLRSTATVNLGSPVHNLLTSPSNQAFPQRVMPQAAAMLSPTASEDSDLSAEDFSETAATQLQHTLEAGRHVLQVFLNRAREHWLSAQLTEFLNNQQFHGGHTALTHVLCQILRPSILSDALHFADHERIALIQLRMLIEAGASVNAANESGYKPLYYALQTGSVPLVNLLLQKGADCHANTEIRLNVNSVPIAYAVDHNQLDIIKLLCGAPYQVKPDTLIPGSRETAIERAVNSGHLTALTLMAEFCDPNYRTGMERYNLLHAAILCANHRNCRLPLAEKVQLILAVATRYPACTSQFNGLQELPAQMASRMLGRQLLVHLLEPLNTIAEQYARSIALQHLQQRELQPQLATVMRAPQQRQRSCWDFFCQLGR